jgi:hypothetical protein
VKLPFTDARCSELDGLLVTDAEIGMARLRWLNTGPVEASAAAVKTEVAKLLFLRGLDSRTLDLSVLPAERRRFLASVGRRSPAAKLARRDRTAPPGKYGCPGIDPLSGYASPLSIAAVSLLLAVRRSSQSTGPRMSSLSPLRSISSRIAPATARASSIVRLTVTIVPHLPLCSLRLTGKLRDA